MANLEVAYAILIKTLKPILDINKIIYLRKNNLSLREIGAIVGVSWSTVQRIIRRVELTYE